LLADKGTILACVSGCVNVEMLVEGKWCPGYLEDVWYVPDIGRHLFSVRSVAEHGISVIIKCKRVILQCDCQLMATDRWMMNAYALDLRVVPREAVEVNIVMASETLHLWHERLGHQDKDHVRKVLEWMEINMAMAEMGGFCDGCVLGEAHQKPFPPWSD
jgi:hypothetical protein